MLKETDFIKNYIKKGTKQTKYSLNFEDDIALVDNYAYSTDTISEDIHFFSDDDPKTIAKKLIRVNISDLISKGVKPKFCLLNFSSGKLVNQRWLNSFFKSFHQDLKNYNLNLIGGDTISTKNKTVLSLTIFGPVNSKKIIKRSTAKFSDFIYVSGTIGDAFIGMSIKKKQIKFDKKAKEKLISKYLVPEPQTNLTNLIRNKANAATDISDGLLNDLNNICTTSKLGAEIKFSSIPKSKEVIKFLSMYKRYEKQILIGGDDYQILFTGPKGLEKYKNVTKIGRMTRKKGIKITDKNFNNLLEGFTHSLY